MWWRRTGSTPETSETSPPPRPAPEVDIGCGEPVEPIFHIARADEWDAAVATGEYRTSTRGATLDEVGFVHCSFRHQVATVGRSFYDDLDTPLVILEIDPTLVGFEVRLEPPTPGSEARFPHVYGPVPVGAVVTVHPVPTRSDRWSVALD